MKTKVYVLLEWLQVDVCSVHSVYASKELLAKALLEAKNGTVYSNAMYYWNYPKGVCWEDGTSMLETTNHTSFESFLNEYIERLSCDEYNGLIYKKEIICE
jgi:hypothetical protein